MIYPEFAYSRQMEFILSITVYCVNTFATYLMLGLILKMYGEKASRKRVFNYSLFNGALQATFIFAIYLIGGSKSFSPMIYLLVTTPNPIFALSYYFSGTKILKLPSIRSIKLMSVFYFYAILVMNISRLTASIFFVQPLGRYNYLLNVFQQVSYVFIIVVAYLITDKLIGSRKLALRLSDKLFFSTKLDISLYTLQSIILYIFLVSLPLIIPNSVLCNAIITAFLALFLIITLLLNINKSQKLELENRNAHISALSASMMDFRGIKHDFYNILQTYGGFIEVGDLEKLKKYHQSLLHLTTSVGNALEIGQRMTENPPLISLLLNKAEYADKLNVQLKIQLPEDIGTFYMDEVDLCRCLACLLDNAIEAAAATESRKAFFSIEPKSERSKLIIITNSANDLFDETNKMAIRVSGKQGHQGLGLYNVRKTLEKYGNCIFQLMYYNHEVSAYMEFRES